MIGCDGVATNIGWKNGAVLHARRVRCFMDRVYRSFSNIQRWMSFRYVPDTTANLPGVDG